MKNNLLLCAAALIAACTISMNAQAQLEVQTSGNVVASKNLTVDQNVAVGTTVDSNASLKIQRQSQTTSPYYGIWSRVYTKSSMPTGAVCGIRGMASAGTISSNYPEITHVVGVFGSANKPAVLSDRFSAGVAGVANYYGGVGVYGAIGSSIDLEIPTSSFGGAYAGYFNGGVMVNGSLTATTISIPSSLQRQENTQQLPASLADNIRLLNPISYTINQNDIWKSDIEAKELQGIHYGLNAQEVKKVYPDLVYERGDQLSINYIELIPILIMKVQELSAEVEELKARQK
ncbi:MAG: tail fiber domain-containing protein [Alphaproteobacteria bacterium]|nr:tail fiber domain-containing protein [Alphaproteobacteria bacterium]